MSELLPAKLRERVPKPGEQEGNKNPIVHAVFSFPWSGWMWFATEGEAIENDFLFYGYVVGFEREWGYFSLSELESVNISGIKLCRDEDHVLRPLSECLTQYGLDEN